MEFSFSLVLGSLRSFVVSFSEYSFFRVMSVRGGFSMVGLF